MDKKEREKFIVDVHNFWTKLKYRGEAELESLGLNLSVEPFIKIELSNSARETCDYISYFTKLMREEMDAEVLRAKFDSTYKPFIIENFEDYIFKTVIK